MKVIWDFVGHAHAIQIVTNYDVSIVCFLFNIIGVFSFEPCEGSNKLANSSWRWWPIFGQIVSNDDAIMATLNNELQLYWQFEYD